MRKVTRNPEKDKDNDRDKVRKWDRVYFQELSSLMKSAINKRERGVRH